MTFTPSDPLFGQQWYLRNTGQSGGTPGMDIRIDGAWTDYTGSGVRIVVIDDGVFYTNPDFVETYDRKADWNFADYSPDATPVAGAYSHGTQVAGFLGSALDGYGVVGVSYGATFAGYRVADDTGSLSAIPQALRAASGFDITNNSYGSEVFGNDGQSLDAIEALATEGRGGLGTVNVFAAGNSRYQVVMSTHGLEQNSPYQINVAATDHDGRIAAFSSPGSNVFVSAPGSDVFNNDGLDTFGFGSTYGTSFAAPIVSGVAALVLEANPGLGYRDVAEILGYSAYDTGGAPLTVQDILNDVPATLSAERVQAITEAAARVTSYPWTTVTNGATDWNGGGLTVSHDFGLGQVDARAATRLAETWNAAPKTTANLAIVQADGAGAQAIPDGDAAGISQTVTITADIRVESAVVEVTIPHGAIGDLRIELMSPQGTVSYLIYNPDYELYGRVIPDRALPQELLDKGTFLDSGDSTILMTTQVYGESSLGDWTLRVADTEAGTAGTLEDWTLTLFGGAASADDRYVYTDQYGTLAATETGRAELTDLDGGIDTLNASAVSGDVLIDLTPGTAGVIAGADFRIAEGTDIENLYTGDGDDFLMGSAAANHLIGGRGDDMLFGRAGNDTLDGGRGLDAALYNGAHSGYAIIGNSDGTVLVSGADGFDTLSNIEVLSFDNGHTAARVPTWLSATGFDAELYLEQNPDVVKGGYTIDTAYQHYLQFGASEGRAANAFFDSAGYLAKYQDVAAAGLNPLSHYYQYGWLEGRDASAFFDSERYLADNPDVAAAGLNPLDHFLRYGVAEGRLAQSAVDWLGM